MAWWADCRKVSPRQNPISATPDPNPSSAAENTRSVANPPRGRVTAATSVQTVGEVMVICPAGDIRAGTVTALPAIFRVLTDALSISASPTVRFSAERLTKSA